MSVRALKLVCFLALFVFAFGGTAPAQSLFSYDKFPGPSIDATKWNGGEVSMGPQNGANLDASRQIVNGQLSVALRTGGGTFSNNDARLGINGLRFNQPLGISQIVFDATVQTLTLQDCAANPDDAFGGIYAQAWFYRENTYFPGGGDVRVRILLGRALDVVTPATRLQVLGDVVSVDASGNEEEIGFVDLGSIPKDATARLSIEWDPATNEITYRLNQRPVQSVQGPASIGAPSNPLKAIGILNAVENCGGHSVQAYTKGIIDNVSIKRLP